MLFPFLECRNRGTCRKLFLWGDASSNFRNIFYIADLWTSLLGLMAYTVW